MLLDPLPHQRLQRCDAHVPQLQSLHLHVQAPVLTEPGQDSPLSVWPHVLCSPCSVARVPTPIWGWKPFHRSPGSLVLFALPFPEHLTLLAKILLDLRPRVSEYQGVGTGLVCSGFVIRKISWEGSSYWGLTPPVLYGTGLVLIFPGPKAARAVASFPDLGLQWGCA